MTIEWWAGDDPADRVAEYSSYLQSIWSQLPISIQQLSRIPSHDANLRRLHLDTLTRELTVDFDLFGSTGRTLRLRYLAVQSYMSTGAPDEGLAGPSGYGDLGYDEVDVEPMAGFVHRMLFSNGIEIEIMFTDVQISENAA